MSLDWGYSDDNGPSTWAEKYPLAAGTRQSPVDIDTALATSDTSLVDRPLSWTYGSDHCYQIVNTGYGWRVDCNGDNTELVGGPLPAAYKLEQFHCHWGPSSDEGSEHTVDGKSYAAELHLVHWNAEKYDSFLEAVSYPDGLAVLGVFFQVGDEELEGLNKIVSMMPDILLKGQTAETNFELDINSLLPETNTYWTYLGSLTTPPCSESVIWIVFKDAVTVTEDQLNAFRNLKTVNEEVEEETEQTLLRKNYRPPLPLGNRVLRECGSF
ncbi:carbonic anhydrase 1 [Cimex lectularius]|uniref:Carbonic anhydrase n=1 Tax=Cimex lectularius TaxID=79782 RepID=A0A8I6R6C8_CIMLE|nr:carbonic anhydrase 1 [Cimex lectularius]